MMKTLSVPEESLLPTRLLIYWNVELKCVKQWFHVFQSNLTVHCSYCNYYTDGANNRRCVVDIFWCLERRSQTPPNWI